MPFSRKTAVSAIAAVALVQFCPAPSGAIPAATAAGINAASAAISATGAVAGTALGVALNGRSVKINGRSVSRIHQRQEHNQQAWNYCRSQLGSASLMFSAPEPGNVLVQGVPPACMTLATVITSQYNQGNPIPMGSDSILFQNLSDEGIQEIQTALNAHPAKL
ncbi:hypothetical protein DL762_002423 [Monosporascus cannonballus]|uniref:Uncharacterized protein n=1 Tax=Monosporascus cannonballus TaxID=155416 RepID=A0ABY0HET2_9PEZI|nr:hypothetical protein DL762_002423 [Monosporascus cannonballus]RYP00194.1 hypothetical protein DL763_000963 [Monosporascus cannonballus]